MAGAAGKGSDECVFCQIVNNQEQTDVIYQDGEYLCFPDRRPATQYHYLVIPKQHVGQAKTLTQQHVPIVERLVHIGRSVLEQKSIPFGDDVRFGFHWPPFNSIDHLHLHVLAPASQMGLLPRLAYRPGTPWFVTADWLLQRLKKMPEDKSNTVQTGVAEP
uniref:adenosine 5'-monophosphoramidase HINT3 isoform X2 n=1 Tax=Myxine glutinosa TaxID=7769 RepID=UPI00358F620A